MPNWLWHLLDYDTVSVVFESAYDLDESIRRLAAATAVFSFTNHYAFGTVTAQKVTLQRIIPFYRNDCKPCFYGKFQQHGEKVQLI